MRGSQPPPRNHYDSRDSLGQRIIARVQRAWTGYWTRHAECATTAILHALDDRTLKDIGLDRSEIESAARCDCQRRGPRLAECRAQYAERDARQPLSRFEHAA